MTERTITTCDGCDHRIHTFDASIRIVAGFGYHTEESQKPLDFHAGPWCIGRYTLRIMADELPRDNALHAPIELLLAETSEAVPPLREEPHP